MVTIVFVRGSVNVRDAPNPWPINGCSFIFSIIDGAKFHAATKITSISLKSTESAAKTGMCEPGVYNPCFKGLSSITKSTNSEFIYKQSKSKNSITCVKLVIYIYFSFK